MHPNCKSSGPVTVEDVGPECLRLVDNKGDIISVQVPQLTLGNYEHWHDTLASAYQSAIANGWMTSNPLTSGPQTVATASGSSVTSGSPADCHPSNRTSDLPEFLAAEGAGSSTSHGPDYVMGDDAESDSDFDDSPDSVADNLRDDVGRYEEAWRVLQNTTYEFRQRYAGAEFSDGLTNSQFLERVRHVVTAQKTRVVIAMLKLGGSGLDVKLTQFHDQVRSLHLTASTTHQEHQRLETAKMFLSHSICGLETKFRKLDRLVREPESQNMFGSNTNDILPQVIHVECGKLREETQSLLRLQRQFKLRLGRNLRKTMQCRRLERDARALFASIREETRRQEDGGHDTNGSCTMSKLLGLVFNVDIGDEASTANTDHFAP